MRFTQFTLPHRRRVYLSVTALCSAVTLSGCAATTLGSSLVASNLSDDSSSQESESFEGDALGKDAASEDSGPEGSVNRLGSKGDGQEGDNGSGDTRADSGAMEPGQLIQVGDFDPESPDFELFDPCSEIPREVFDEVGFGEQVTDTISLTGRTSCGYVPPEGPSHSPNFTLMADELQDDRLYEDNLVLREGAKVGPVEIVVHSLDRNDEQQCGASVSTSRGRLALMLTSLDSSYFSGNELCDVTEDYLRKLLTKIGGKDGRNQYSASIN